MSLRRCIQNVVVDKTMREFGNGAIRSSAQGKIDWLGVRHPKVEASFGNYMRKHTQTEDGKTRAYDNWWSGWDENVSIQSLIRHVEDLNAIQAGQYVYKIKDFHGEHTLIYDEQNKKLDDFGARITKEDCYNAIRFNCGAGLLEHLRKNSELK